MLTSYMLRKTSRRTFLLNSFGLAGAAALPFSSYAQANQRKPVFGRNGAAATSQPIATATALHILQSGGSAVDAAIAAAAMLGLAEPMMSGPGGDLFAQVFDPDNGLVAIDSAGESGSRKSFSDMKKTSGGKSTMPKHGVHSVTVPGAIAGWLSLHDRFGKLPLSTLLAPAVSAARRGLLIGQQTATDWHSAYWIDRSVSGVAGSFAEFDKVFLPNTKPPGAGTLFHNRDYATSLEAIAKEGRSAFYGDGEIASKILKALGTHHAITYEDLANHRAKWVTPVGARYRGFDVMQLPPPGQGVTALQMLTLLEGTNLSQFAITDPQRLHAIMEATKIAYRDRANMISDGASLDMLAPDRISQQKIKLDSALTNDIMIPYEEGDTSYLCVGDQHGQMISLITSVSSPFGSAIVPTGTGFCLQNRAAGFNLKSGHPNAYAPKKQPFHTIIPGFVFRDGLPWMAFGVMGGAMQPQGQVQILSSVIDHGLDIQAAGDFPRLRLYGGSEPDQLTQKRPHFWRIENGFPKETIDTLRSMGHEIEVGTDNKYVRYGGYQAIQNLKIGGYTAATESRQDGVALAY